MSWLGCSVGCCTRQLSASRTARRRFRPDFSAILPARRAGMLQSSLLAISCTNITVIAAARVLLWTTSTWKKYLLPECCGSGSKLDSLSGPLWIRIRNPNTDPDPGTGTCKAFQNVKNFQRFVINIRYRYRIPLFFSIYPKKTIE